MSATSRHTLLYGLKTQLETDSTETAQQVARFVIEQRRGVRLLDSALRRTAHTPIARAFAALNATRCYLRMRESGPTGGVLSCAYRANERAATDLVRAMLGTTKWCDVEIDFRDVRRDLAAATALEPRRLARIAGLLARRYEPFRMLRAVELLGYDARFARILDGGRYRVAVMSSYSNPWGIALNIAARRRGIPIVLVMHGMPLWPLPRLDYDLAIVNNQAAYETLLRADCRIDRIIVKSGRARYRPMPAALPATEMTVGVLLSKDPVAERVTTWLHALARDPRVGAIIVRKHPANLWTKLDEALSATELVGRVSISTTPSIVEDIRRCDLVIAGNSSAHVDAVATGVRSIFARGLDGAPDDVLGLVRDGVVFPTNEPSSLDLDEVVRFYAHSAWLTGLRRHINIDQDDDAVAAATRAAFRELGAGA
jgi:hypothetical protein